MTHIHLIGIGGSGLSAIALFLHGKGYKVTGSDVVDSTFARELRAMGVKISIGHHPENIAGADLVVRSSAIPDQNPEVLAARSTGIPVLKRADYLGQLMQGKQGIAVAGTHGKTTASAMLAWVLTFLELDPSFIIGGVLQNLEVNAHAGEGPHFVIEADEYDRMFLGLKPEIEIVTNLEHDHPDCYPTFADIRSAFVHFIRLLPRGGTLVACSDDPGAAALLKEAGKVGIKNIPYGLREQWAHASDLDVARSGGCSFHASIGDQSTFCTLQVPGTHNILNAIAVLTVISVLGLSIEKAARGLGDYKGTGRRFEIIGETNGIVVIDDYAHHPTEIRATLAAARQGFPDRRLWAVWQPHTYSRTQALFDEFAGSFNDADHVIVTEIYKAREGKRDFSSQSVVKAMKHPSVQFIKELQDVSDRLLSCLVPGDVLLVLSAGDADQVSREVFSQLKERENRHA